MNHTGTVTLKTNRLILRKFTKDDANAVYMNYGSDQNVNKFITFAPCKTIDSTNNFLQMHIEKYSANKTFYAWGIEKDGEIIGSIGAFDVNEEMQSVELGYSIGSAYWGQGLATEAAKAVIDYLFKVVGFHRIFASHHIDNIGSGKVM